MAAAADARAFANTLDDEAAPPPAALRATLLQAVRDVEARARTPAHSHSSTRTTRRALGT
jgi:hypothetical protein